MAEYHAAERPGHIADGVRGERQDGARKRIEGWKEDDVEDQRRHQVVDGKVVPLQRGPDRAGRGQAAHLGVGTGLARAGCSADVGCGGNHFAHDVSSFA
ncbi:hypothetical protein D3C72_2053720 [compost metagenome]